MWPQYDALIDYFSATAVDASADVCQIKLMIATTARHRYGHYRQRYHL